jgi:hypothetical protein
MGNDIIASFDRRFTKAALGIQNAAEELRERE